jgi:murein DD-endopeptidase MepM/ murein hydrolase activator NlpD
VARHRSPLGRRAHLGPPLPAVMAAAGVGGASRPIPFSQLTSSLPVRFAATVLAGGALAAAGQQALAATLPAATDGTNVLRLGVEELFGTTGSIGTAAEAAVADVTALAPTAAPLVADPRVAVGPVTPEPVVADASGLVKAADLQRAAAEAAAAAHAEAATAAAAAKAAATSVGGGVQMIVGRLSSGFGGRWGTTHQGLDIAAPIGTPIHVPLDGTVISSGPASGFGLWVRVQHADGTITVYGHINRSLVTVGEKVKAGDVIAETGNRGESTGPHLHIGVMIDGRYVDPRPWLDQHGIGY